MPEDLLTLRDVPRHVPWPTPPSYATVIRWHTTGVRGIKLRTFMVAGRRLVSLVDLQAFLAGREPPAVPPDSPHAPTVPDFPNDKPPCQSSRRKEVARAS